MQLDATKKRRWFGTTVLLGALAMLVCGETFLKGRLNPFLMVCYWTCCLVLTSLAVMAAFRDLRAIQQRTRREHRELLEATLKDIEADARTKPRRPTDPRAGDDSTE